VVWFLGGGTQGVWPSQTFTTSTLWNNNSTQTATTTSSIRYVTITQTVSSTMRLYTSPTWTDQWTAPTWSSIQDDRQWLAQQRMAAQQQNAALAMELQRQARPYGAGIAAPAVHRTRENPAARRARELLLSYLSDDQRRTFEEHNWFVVIGGRSGRRYRISGVSYAGNVQLLCADNDNIEATFCGHCNDNIPLGDQLLAQKVMLEIDEPAYIALANRRPAMRAAA
jgi:hypothetical protein